MAVGEGVGVFYLRFQEYCALKIKLLVEISVLFKVQYNMHPPFFQRKKYQLMKSDLSYLSMSSQNAHFFNVHVNKGYISKN